MQNVCWFNVAKLIDCISEKQIISMKYKDFPLQKYSFNYSFGGKIVKISILLLRRR